MRTIRSDGVRIAGICSCIPSKSVDNLARCTEAYGDAERALGVVKATGIRSRRVLDDGATALDLCVRAAREVMGRTRTAADEIGAVVYVTFTPDRLMPCNACMAQKRLGLGTDTVAFDLNLACSGWLYGVYVAGLLVRSSGRKVLLLDGDTQTPHVDPADAAMVPLLSDAGTATLLEPAPAGDPFLFGFLTDGAKGEALQLPPGGTFAMDGFAVFRFATTDVLRFIREFMDAVGKSAREFDAFVPHQANVFMIEQIARKLGFDSARLKKSGDVLGNSSSASVPTTIAYAQARGALLAAGFGGGLSASVAQLPIDAGCELCVVEQGGGAER